MSQQVSALPSLRAGAGDADGWRAQIDVWVPKKVEVFLRPPMPVGGLPVDTWEPPLEEA